jgi:hypothetical protein
MQLILAATLAAAVSPWCHTIFSAENGAQVQFDYQIADHDDGQLVSADYAPAWINVTLPGATGRESVTAVAVARYRHNRCTTCFKDDVVKQVPLGFAGAGRFTGSPGSLPLYRYENGDDMSFSDVVELAVVVDGNWLVVPGSGGAHNFHYDPNENPQRECAR